MDGVIIPVGRIAGSNPTLFVVLFRCLFQSFTKVFARFAIIAMFFDSATERFDGKYQFLRCIFTNHFSVNITLPSPQFTVPAVVAFVIGESLALLLIEVFTVFTLFTVFFDGAEGRFECKNLFVKVRFWD